MNYLYLLQARRKYAYLSEFYFRQDNFSLESQ